MLLRTFGWSFAVTAAVLLGALLLGSAETAAIVAILAVLEVSLSFDNAVVNATVLRRMSPFWQRIFLTVGIAIAVFGTRLVFPLVIVGLTAKLGPFDVLDLALNHEQRYQATLLAAHPAIAAFGGVYLLMIFLDFVLTTREITWFGALERPLARAGRLSTLPSVVALLALVAVAQSVPERESRQVLIAGVSGLATYLVVAGLAALFADEDEEPRATPTIRSGLSAFLYLEMLDASFSFDGVVGAFAITTDIFVIAAGLGVGAMYVRSITVALVRHGTLGRYLHLEHGAHYAIGALAVLLFASIEHEVPELVTGLIGVGFIAFSLVTSILLNRRTAAAGDAIGSPAWLRSTGMVETSAMLSAPDVGEVLALVAAAADADGVAPLSEHVLLHLRHGGDVGGRHLLARRDGRVTGYGFVDTTDDVEGPSGELVVHPEYRRRGIGRELLAAAREEADGRPLRLWAHGSHPGSAALAHEAGLPRVRELRQLRRSLLAPIPPVVLPEGVAVRTLRPGPDDDAWVELNRIAFADHPEQGRWTVADLHRRIGEPWFDPAGFFIAERDGRLVGFHWTKVHGGGTEHGHEHGHEPIGEVYVVGVHPDERGTGLGRALTVLGLRHLRSRGLTQVMLYVDAGNTAAVALYERLGFTPWDTDVMFGTAADRQVRPLLRG